MNKVFLSHAFNEKESDYVQLLKDELKSNGVQIYENNHLEIKDYIISGIHDSINKCDLLIAFMIDNNLNVAYDVGYAMAKGKKVLIISADYSEIPFYLKTVPTILLRDYFDTSCAILNFVDNC
jgi:nucleoside 2-deoxyribosyltransferase